MSQSLDHHPCFELSLELGDTANKTGSRRSVGSCLLQPGAERSQVPTLAQEAVSDIGPFGDQTLMLFLHKVTAGQLAVAWLRPKDADNGCFHPMNRFGVKAGKKGRIFTQFPFFPNKPTRRARCLEASHTCYLTLFVFAQGGGATVRTFGVYLVSLFICVSVSTVFKFSTE